MKVFFLALVLVFFGAEATSRLFRPILVQSSPSFYYLRYMQDLHERSDRLLWQLKPGAQSSIENSQKENITYEVNAFGFRGPMEIQEGPPIFLFGDSFSFATGVSYEKSFPALLKEKLKIPVWNFGVMGYAPDQALILWREWSKKNKPKAVILQISNNDLQDLFEHRWVASNGVEITGTDWLPYSLQDTVQRESFSHPIALVNLIRYFQLLAQKSSPDPKKIELGLARLERVLEQFAMEVRKGQKLPLVILQASDFGAQVYGLAAASRFEQIVEGIAKKYGAIYYAPSSGLQATNFLPFPDLHWNAATHALVAEELAKRFQKRP